MDAIMATAIGNTMRKIDVEVPHFTRLHLDATARKPKFNFRRSQYGNMKPYFPVFIAEFVIGVLKNLRSSG